MSLLKELKKNQISGIFNPLFNCRNRFNKKTFREHNKFEGA